MFKKYLIIRSKPHGKEKINEFKEGMISIGWPVGSSFKNNSREDIKKKVTGTSVTQIENFITLSVGDIVLTPAENKSLLIFEITSPYAYDQSKDNDEIGNPHYVQGKILSHLQNYPSELENVIKASRRAVSNITKYSTIIEEILNPTSKKEIIPEEVSKEVQEALKTLKELLSDENSEIRLKAATEILKFNSNK